MPKTKVANSSLASLPAEGLRNSPIARYADGRVRPPNFLPADPKTMAVPGLLSNVSQGLAKFMNYQPLRNQAACDAAKNFWIGARQVSGTSLNTPTEKAMMGRYFGGGGGSYHLQPPEWDAAVKYYDTYKHNVVSGPTFPMRDGSYRQLINFAGSYGEPVLDGLLGTATGYFDKNKKLVAIRDKFDFDDNERGPWPIGKIAGKVVGATQNDANTFCPKGSNPVTITGGARR